MGTPQCTPEFKEEAVRQVTDVSEHLCVSQHSHYKWVRSIKPDASRHQTQDLLDARTETLLRKAQLKRTLEEQDILTKAARSFAREPD